MKKMLIILFTIVILTGCQSNQSQGFKDLEKSFVASVKEYYDNNINGVVYPPFSCTEVTINQMSDAGVSVDAYVNAGCNVDDTAAFVVVKDSSDPANIKYEIVPNLSCGDSSSTVTNSQKSLNQCVSSYFKK